MASRPSRSHGPIFAGGAIAFGVGFFALAPYVFSTTYVRPLVAAITATSSPVAEVAPLPTVAHVKTPASVKGIYMSQCVVGTPSFRDSLVKLVDDTELNSIVIDIKDFTGKIAFPTDDPILKDSVSDACGAHDMKEFVKKLHDKGIYVIGRITVFQDPNYTKLHPEQSVQSKARPGEPWKDRKGLSFISSEAKPYWNYVVALSKYAHDVVGFDELNYDYIRWPSDGDMKDVAYPAGIPRAEAIEHFWKHLYENVHPTGAIMSADLFGYVTVLEDDLGIGQQLERALPYFDYIDPMVYPSHYNNGFAGIANVNNDPYKVVHVSMVRAVERTIASTTKVASLSETPIMQTVTIPAHPSTSSGQVIATTTEERATGFYAKPSYPANKMRPWLQSFDYPVPYTPAMVAAQIKANTDAGLNSYIFWDAANKYSALRQVVAAE
ncbi:MAG TPA: putative glycoside hydrolase [Candidatus Paceibacterota bacterium]|nr:putative glycoside hydrolase [Candidatus Paceibacterota bacterium]